MVFANLMEGKYDNGERGLGKRTPYINRKKEDGNAGDGI